MIEITVTVTDIRAGERAARARFFALMLMVRARRVAVDMLNLQPVSPTGGGMRGGHRDVLHARPTLRPSAGHARLALLTTPRRSPGSVGLRVPPGRASYFG